MKDLYHQEIEKLEASRDKAPEKMQAEIDFVLVLLRRANEKATEALIESYGKAEFALAQTRNNEEVDCLRSDDRFSEKIILQLCA